MARDPFKQLETVRTYSAGSPPLKEYSKTSIARARLVLIPARWNTLADSMFRFFASLISYYCCGGYLIKPELPEVRI